MVKNYLPNWIATIKLLLRRTLAVQQSYSAIVAVAAQGKVQNFLFMPFL